MLVRGFLDMIHIGIKNTPTSDNLMSYRGNHKCKNPNNQSEQQRPLAKFQAWARLDSAGSNLLITKDDLRFVILEMMTVDILLNTHHFANSYFSGYSCRLCNVLNDQSRIKFSVVIKICNC